MRTFSSVQTAPATRYRSKLRSAARKSLVSVAIRTKPALFMRQVIDDAEGKTLASAFDHRQGRATVKKPVRNSNAAADVGKAFAEAAKKAGR